jgi:predicted DNA-binding antitoxin AbrB/MazE fold protein
MAITVEAVYENGVLRPSQPLPLKDHEKVELVIRTRSGEHSEPPTLDPERSRQEALERLLRYQLPVADWDEMEQEIIRGATE